MRTRGHSVSVCHSCTYNKPRRLLQASLPFVQEGLRALSCLHSDVSSFLPKSRKSPIVLSFPPSVWRRLAGPRLRGLRMRSTSPTRVKTTPAVQPHPLIKTSSVDGGRRALAASESPQLPPAAPAAVSLGAASARSVRDVSGKVTHLPAVAAWTRRISPGRNVLLFLFCSL